MTSEVQPTAGRAPCPDCLTAAVRPHHGFRANCPGCCARGAARSPHYRRCSDAGVQDRAYRGLLAQFGLTHAAVQAAHAADAMNREKA